MESVPLTVAFVSPLIIIDSISLSMRNETVFFSRFLIHNEDSAMLLVDCVYIDLNVCMCMYFVLPCTKEK